MVENLIKLKRKQQRITLAELEASTQIPAPVISMVEKGLLMPDSDLQIRLAQALHTKKEKLFPESGTRVK